MSEVVARALEGLPEIAPGDDLAALLTAAAGGDLRPGDVLVVAHKVVSKAEGALRDLAAVQPGARARELAARLDKDPIHVQVVLDESAAVLRAERGVLICRTRHGFVCANAGVDASNAPAPGVLVTLPRDPDASARALRAALPGRPAVVIADSFGRAWRHGQCDVAIGIAGLAPLADWRGRRDVCGHELRATWIATADQAAAAADLARAKDSRQPAVRIRGLEAAVMPEDGPGAAALVRAAAEDLFL
ncbi:MAG: coenzyme F420-0:L-glutamate ligase [Solirubrobacteraceae bacterium]